MEYKISKFNKFKEISRSIKQFIFIKEIGIYLIFVLVLEGSFVLKLVKYFKGKMWENNNSRLIFCIIYIEIIFV